MGLGGEVWDQQAGADAIDAAMAIFLDVMNVFLNLIKRGKFFRFRP